MAYGEEFVTVDMDATADEVRSFFRRNVKSITEAMNERLAEMVKNTMQETLASKLEGMTDYLIDAIQEHAEGEDLSLKRVKAAVEQNDWSLDDLGIELNLSELDLEAVAYEHGSESLVDAAVENECANNVLGYVMNHLSDADDTLNAMTDVFTADQFAEFMVSSLLEGDKSWASRISPLNRQSLGRLLLVDELAAAAAERGETLTSGPAPVTPVNVEALRASIEQDLRAKIEAETRLKVMQEVMTLMAGGK